MAEDPNAELSRQEYWDERYGKDAEKGEKSYDWLRNFDTIRPFLTKHLPAASANSSILHMGNGNSVGQLVMILDLSVFHQKFDNLTSSDKQTLPASLLELGYTNQTAIDFSPVVTQNMATAHPDINWQVMDIRKLTYQDFSWDICIDKATLDAMLYGSLWDPEDEVRENVKSYVDEIARVLKPRGMWLYITWRQPHFIRPLVQRPDIWTFEVETLSDGAGMFEYFGFVFKKKI